MRAFGVVGRGAVTVRDRLASSLAEEGRVAVITGGGNDWGGNERADDGARHAATTYHLGANGWSATGGERSLAAVLDDLTVDHEYAIVTGHADATLPHVVIGDPGYDGEVLHETDDPRAVDGDAVRDPIDEIEPRETLESLVAAVEGAERADRAGAIATFTGRVRERDGPEDDPTNYLEFDRYDDVAEDRMSTIRADLEAREGVYAVRLHHRTGVIEAGEHIVHVVILAGHRTEAFEAVEDGIDRLKDEVPIFKREVTADESFWLHER